MNGPTLPVGGKGMLRASGLSKRYRTREVVSGVNVRLAPGETVGLLGPNGAGKTTTFYMIVGLVAPTTGVIHLDDRDITQEPMYRRARAGISYLPQEPSVFRKLSVRDNVLAILETQPLSREERLARLDQLLEDLGIAHLAETKGFSLSGGERRRVEVARALAIKPRFILLDEPFAGVDPLAVGEIQAMICKLRDQGIGVLITDHNVRETLEICSRVYILSEGGILAEGASDEVVVNPKVRQMYLGENFWF